MDIFLLEKSDLRVCFMAPYMRRYVIFRIQKKMDVLRLFIACELDGIVEYCSFLKTSPINIESNTMNKLSMKVTFFL